MMHVRLGADFECFDNDGFCDTMLFFAELDLSTFEKSPNLYVISWMRA
jgi:hypothetical protein